MLRHLPPLRAGYPASADLGARRARLPAAWTAAMLAPGTTARDEFVGGVACLVCAPAEPREAPRERLQDAILYLHGGGYRLGSPAGWAHLASRLAAATQEHVVIPGYRLAPEHPFPAALHDAVAVYQALAGAHGPGPVAAGDSAGGGLAAALALACPARQLPKPRALILFSPWLDLACGENRAATDQFFPRDAAREAAALYLQGHDPADPLASPLHGDLAGFPPALLFASASEYLLGDVLAFRGRLADAGSPPETTILPDMPHAWPVTAPGSAQTEETLQAAARFIMALA